MSLFVTATAMDPIEQKYTDGYEGEFAIPDHRRMYRFENRTGRLRYKPPGAWADPDIETPSGEEHDALNATQQLPPREPGRRHWLADGGILDNAPFGPVLDAIAAGR